VARGKVSVNDYRLEAGDAVQASGVERIELRKGEAAEVLLFDLP
jgi:hypothetical protein